MEFYIDLYLQFQSTFVLTLYIPMFSINLCHLVSYENFAKIVKKVYMF